MIDPDRLGSGVPARNQIESIAEEASGGDEEDHTLTVGPFELRDHLGARLLPHSALQDKGLVTLRLEARHEIAPVRGRREAIRSASAAPAFELLGFDVAA